jgi:hypothetical protein
MSSKTLARQVFDSTLPEGAMHQVPKDSDFDKFYTGITDFQQDRIDRIFTLACVRNPQETDMLPDMEVEYGIRPDDRFAEQDRRNLLDSKVYATECLGTDEYLQDRLNRAGFDVQVHKNDPEVDPALFLSTNYQMVAGGDDAFAGNDAAFAGQSGGFYILSGVKGSYIPAYLSQAGDMFAGGLHSSAGEFLDSIEIPYVVADPVDPDSWSQVFFVGGDAVRNETTGAIEQISPVVIQSARQSQFEDIICRYKPDGTWAAVVGSYG